jgi:hypothetical protein
LKPKRNHIENKVGNIQVKLAVCIVEVQVEHSEQQKQDENNEEKNEDRDPKDHSGENHGNHVLNKQ